VDSLRRKPPAAAYLSTKARMRRMKKRTWRGTEESDAEVCGKGYVVVQGIWTCGG